MSKKRPFVLQRLFGRIYERERGGDQIRGGWGLQTLIEYAIPEKSKDTF